MSAPKVTKKPATAAAARVDPKKVATLRETFPFLSEEAAALHLAEANGNVSAASDLVLNGDRWKTTSGTKPRKVKEEKTEEPIRHERKPRDDRDRNEPRGERKPFVKRSEEKAAPAAPTVTAAQVQQKDVASSSAWVKGKGLSFADMVKKTVEVPVVAPPPPPPAPAAPAVAPAPAAPAATTEEAAVEEKPLKQRRERKPREAPVATEAEVAAPAPAPVPVPVAPKPVVVKHVLRFDRVDELLLPPHLADLALRAASTYTFSGTAGVEPTPPPQTQPVSSFQQQQNAFAMQRTWGAPDHNVAQRWDSTASWGQPSAPQQPRGGFTAYQQPQQPRFNNNFVQNQQYQPRGNFNNNNMMHHNHHRGGHEQQASNEAYNAIREGYSHPSGATW